ncbi:hypothetical protein L198_04348 [Cryptococcus wingfieldii CBS 7118]|uniref:Uncharacterized protein n=1 Tax=Cryptococcus wingfieldii CBS 7118 TaxID=1295528 RepID=A0A1E3J4D1_9TREE|nr:hypothetical protein L198_04348 [Cryptococcus wingfieldii CBS 7118]ODN95730.1 hypothetical protein L198_04348 [Cryptococcus wingfieldii CBS 7118]
MDVSIESPSTNAPGSVDGFDEDNQEDYLDVDIPELNFPPFPKLPSALTVVSFDQFEHKGVWTKAGLVNSEAGPSQPHDALGVPLVAMERPYTGINHTFEEREAHKKEKRKAATERKRDFPITLPNGPKTKSQSPRLDPEDCWKIGDPNSDWVEPSVTSTVKIDVSIPPFTRLINATREFILSRDAVIQSRKNRHLFGILRDQLRIRSLFLGRHWPGSGPNAALYPLRKRRYVDDNAPTLLPTPKGVRVDEACVLLRDPERSVRRLLTLARMKLDSPWNEEPVLDFLEIAAAYFSYIAHYNVFPEANLHNSFKKVASIARSASKKWKEATQLEGIVTKQDGWNRACWAVWGGEFSGPEEMGPEKPAEVEGQVAQEEPQEEDDEDAVTWTVEPIVDKRPSAPTLNEVLPIVKDLLSPRSHSNIRLLRSIPYASRIIVAVLPPLPAGSDAPRFSTQLHRLVTIKSPAASNQEEDKEPDEIVVWVEGDGLMVNGGNQLVGMVLQGRWGLLGEEEDQEGSWWAFKARHCVLPAI